MLAFIALLGGSIGCVLYFLRGEQWLDSPELQGFAGGMGVQADRAGDLARRRRHRVSPARQDGRAAGVTAASPIPAIVASASGSY